MNAALKSAYGAEGVFNCQDGALQQVYFCIDSTLSVCIVCVYFFELLFKCMHARFVCVCVHNERGAKSKYGAEGVFLVLSFFFSFFSSSFLSSFGTCLNYFSRVVFFLFVFFFLLLKVIECNAVITTGLIKEGPCSANVKYPPITH